MNAVRFGTRLEMGLPNYEAVRDHARLAERLGYEAVWARDHVSLEDVTGEATCLECWTVLSALARDTTSILLGSLVLCVPFRNPALLAKMASTLQLASNGRLILGLGAGHVRSEFDEYGYDFPSPGDRVRMLQEAVEIIRLMWTERRPSYRGRFFRIANALNEPKPTPIPPLMIGATRPRALRVVARHADLWNSPDDIEGFLAGREELLRACEEVGRDPAEIRMVARLSVIVDRDEAAAKRRHERVCEARTGQPYLRHRILVGTPEQIAERVAPLVAGGVRDFITAFWETDRQAECLEQFMTEVAPLIRQHAAAR
ncbi:MAG: LLM class flavin-dependent oxidoreductase [Chloroflexota bacterium]|nr:LLM class flavin-dependent oxidoreductase [Dehalococcoidia bacterium]MDW8253901.1 LLM class flavin-dependent oxidoreductase [Chloroflexota bacterium]